jgi:quercetin dioxygenase-like cupin family protein
MDRLDNGILLSAPSAGNTYQVLNDKVTIRLSGDDTGGAFSLIEFIAPPSSGPPPHIHSKEDETFYVLEGELEFWTPLGTKRCGPGTVLFLPRNVPHGYTNVGTTPARFLMMVTPPGIEKFMAEMGAMPPGPPDFPKIVALAGRYGMEFVPQST